ncbi:hypothetical protein Acr_00g0006450 [Actinidia rufa]|uniref:Uncharacterized protein n=1 Tax=Actinidia rufa TaxID=165716 RepID=A0A7J0D9R5_9ERIC|nr:hypothetical protein Acr_00g0006450 [Actinidia rufa]
MDGDSDWARANETYDGIEEGYDSSRDEFFSVSSYNPGKEKMHSAFGTSLPLQSSIGRSSNQDASYVKEHTSISSYAPLAQLSVAEVLYDSVVDVLSPRKSTCKGSPSQKLKHSKPLSKEDYLRVPSVPGNVEPRAYFLQQKPLFEEDLTTSDWTTKFCLDFTEKLRLILLLQ